MRDTIERVFVVLMRISNTPGQPLGHDDGAKLTMSRTNHAGALISVVASIIYKMTRGDFELGNVEETISNHVMHGSRAHRPASVQQTGMVPVESRNALVRCEAYYQQRARAASLPRQILRRPAFVSFISHSGSIVQGLCSGSGEPDPVLSLPLQDGEARH